MKFSVDGHHWHRERFFLKFIQTQLKKIPHELSQLDETMIRQPIHLDVRILGMRCGLDAVRQNSDERYTIQFGLPILWLVSQG